MILRLIGSLAISLFLISGCRVSDIFDAQQTDGEVTVYLQDWINSPNLTYCSRKIDREYEIDGYFCVERLTKIRYYIPISQWNDNFLEAYFVSVSKKQLLLRLKQDDALRDYILSKGIKADKDSDIKHMKVLEPYKVK